MPRAVCSATVCWRCADRAAPVLRPQCRQRIEHVGTAGCNCSTRSIDTSMSSRQGVPCTMIPRGTVLQVWS